MHHNQMTMTDILMCVFKIRIQNSSVFRNYLAVPHSECGSLTVLSQTLNVDLYIRLLVVKTLSMWAMTYNVGSSLSK